MGRAMNIASAARGVFFSGYQETTGRELWTLSGPTASIADVTAAEGSAGITLFGFTVTLSAPSAQTVGVTYQTQNGTAIAGGDYTAASGTLTFTPGQTQRMILVAVAGDTTVEPDRTFTVRLTAVTNGFLGRDVATGTIVNDDPGGVAPTTPQYRLYHEGTKEHLYTTDLNEYNVLATQGWDAEGIAYRMFGTTGTFGGVGVIPFYRLYHPGIVQHHWTTDPNEAVVLAGTGVWTYEGIIGYLLPTSAPGTVPLYRMFLESPPLHLWTTDATEYAVLQTRGWTAEGICGYVAP